MERKCVTTDYFWKTHKKVDQVLHEIVPQLAERATDDLIENNLKPFLPTTTTSTKTTSSADLQHQLYLKMKSNIQDQANNPALGSSSKQSAKDFITYVFKKQQEWDAWVEETVIDEDE
ncbi:hypothetical protein Tco_0207206, partial [Tanacetum coccineum]